MGGRLLDVIGHAVFSEHVLFQFGIEIRLGNVGDHYWALHDVFQARAVALEARLDVLQQQANDCAGRLDGYKQDAESLSDRLERFNVKAMRLLNQESQTATGTGSMDKDDC